MFLLLRIILISFLLKNIVNFLLFLDVIVLTSGILDKNVKRQKDLIGRHKEENNILNYINITSFKAILNMRIMLIYRLLPNPWLPVCDTFLTCVIDVKVD